jgi:hypothetical protein
MVGKKARGKGKNISETDSLRAVVADLWEVVERLNLCVIERERPPSPGITLSSWTVDKPKRTKKKS